MRFRPSIFIGLAAVSVSAVAQVPVAQPLPAALPVANASAPVAQPAPVAAQPFTQSPAYIECTKLAASNPLEAERKAVQWLQVDDGVGAHHCLAMALYGQRRFAEAADQLIRVRAQIPADQMALRTYVARQGVKAYMDAGRPDAAIDLLGTQITDMSNGGRGNNANNAKLAAELLLDRARMRLTYGQLAEAVQDLDHAVSLTPINEDILLERGAAFNQLGDRSLALQDIASVLKINPKNEKALALRTRINQTGPVLKPL